MPTLASIGSRLTRLAAVVSMCSALLAGSGLAVTASGATGRAGTSRLLSSASFVVVEKTLVASLPLDSGVRFAWREAFRASCKQLNTRMALLDAYRAVCLDSATVYDLSAAFEACSELTPTTLKTATRPNVANRCQGRAENKQADANLQLVAAFDGLNKILVRDHLSALCRAAFGGTPAAISYYTKMVPVLRLMATGFLTNAPQKTAEAENRGQQLEGKYLLPSNHQQLAQFKRGCASVDGR